MKVECRFCGKVLDEKDVFMDTDQNGKFYFFCDQEHRDVFVGEMREHAYDMTLMLNPLYGIVLMGKWLRNKIKNKNK